MSLIFRTAEGFECSDSGKSSKSEGLDSIKSEGSGSVDTE